MRLASNVAIVTGGGTGIGAAIARLLAKEGAQVTITGCLSTRQPVDAQVSEAELATRTPEETTHLRLVEMLGQMETCPGWAGPARAPGLNGRRHPRPERGVCRQMQSNRPIEARMGETRTRQS
jgi:NAD(P)-dependent dehydrogenase (short-subunit alcohol dehydrogenase family)